MTIFVFCVVLFVLKAAKRMWDLNEEENGGSPFLQAKIYWATNRVEYAFKKGFVSFLSFAIFF